MSGNMVHIIKVITGVLKKNGLLHGAPVLTSALFNRFFPKRIKDYEKYTVHFVGANGLEIGGPTRMFSRIGCLPIYPVVANLDCCNYSEMTGWNGAVREGMTYNYHKDEIGYQYICDAVDLRPIQARAYDFILASHVIEHIANPLKAISDWLRVLRDDGILLIIAPNGNITDPGRPVSTMSHLIEDFEKDTKEDDLAHLPEALKMIKDNTKHPSDDHESLTKNMANNYKTRYLHHHVFNADILAVVFDYFRLAVIAPVELFPPHHIIVMGKKAKNNE